MRVFLSVFVVGICAAALWYLALGLAPVKEVRLAAGGKGGGYWAVAERYERILARDGIRVTILETAGSQENAERLANGTADVALLQGGIDAPEGTEALGAIFREPLFVFARSQAAVPSNPGAWTGLRIAVGAEGSGTRVVANQFRLAAGHGPQQNTLVPLSGGAAAEALMAGDVDIALFVAPLAAPYLAPLFADPGLNLVALDHLAALTGRLQQSTQLLLPAGAVSLAPLLPDRDTPMLALTARLVARDRLHPSLVDRLVEAAKIIHGRRDPITREGAFPTAEGLSIPVDVYARDLIRSGPSSLQQYLPYWVVAQINRFAILLVPIFFLLLPLLRILPGLYQWRMRHLVFRRYNDIEELDAQLASARDDELPPLEARLNEIDRELAAMDLPAPYKNLAYTARMHIDMLRRRITDRA